MGCGTPSVVDTCREQDTILHMLYTGVFNVLPEKTSATSVRFRDTGQHAEGDYCNCESEHLAPTTDRNHHQTRSGSGYVAIYPLLTVD